MSSPEAASSPHSHTDHPPSYPAYPSHSPPASEPLPSAHNVVPTEPPDSGKILLVSGQVLRLAYSDEYGESEIYGVVGGKKPNISYDENIKSTDLDRVLKPWLKDRTLAGMAAKGDSIPTKLTIVTEADKFNDGFKTVYDISVYDSPKEP